MSGEKAKEQELESQTEEATNEQEQVENNASEEQPQAQKEQEEVKEEVKEEPLADPNEPGFAPIDLSNLKESCVDAAEQTFEKRKHVQNLQMSKGSTKKLLFKFVLFDVGNFW